MLWTRRYTLLSFTDPIALNEAVSAWGTLLIRNIEGDGKDTGKGCLIGGYDISQTQAVMVPGGSSTTVNVGPGDRVYAIKSDLNGSFNPTIEVLHSWVR